MTASLVGVTGSGSVPFTMAVSIQFFQSHQVSLYTRTTCFLLFLFFLIVKFQEAKRLFEQEHDRRLLI